ncbi:MAG: ABC transporter permease [Dongiaceae bacterium]
MDKDFQKIFRETRLIAKREVVAYTATPLALLMIGIYVVASAALSIYFGGFLARGIADLASFFAFQPWLLLILSAALSMRLWAEERRLGTDEVLLTLPLNYFSLILGKFLAAWALGALAHVMAALPLWLSLVYLGEPDHGVIIAGILAHILLAAAYTALGGFLSSLTRHQISAFMMTIAAGFILSIGGVPFIRNWLVHSVNPFWRERIDYFSLFSKLEGWSQGDVTFTGLFLFVTLTALLLMLTWLGLQARRGVPDEK